MALITFIAGSTRYRSSSHARVAVSSPRELAVGLHIPGHQLIREIDERSK